MDYPAAGYPTDFVPRSVGKIIVMQERYERREPLFHPNDARMPDAESLIASKLNNGSVVVTGRSRVQQGNMEVVERYDVPRNGRRRTAQEKDRGGRDYIRMFEAHRKRKARREKARNKAS